MALILVDKGEIQKPAYTIMFQDIVGLFTRRYILKS